MTSHLIQTLEDAFSRLVQQVKTGETHLIEFARGDWEKVKEALASARADITPVPAPIPVAYDPSPLTPPAPEPEQTTVSGELPPLTPT